jgi:hypothetical protein
MANSAIASSGRPSLPRPPEVVEKFSDRGTRGQGPNRLRTSEYVERASLSLAGQAIQIAPASYGHNLARFALSALNEYRCPTAIDPAPAPLSGPEQRPRELRPRQTAC